MWTAVGLAGALAIVSEARAQGAPTGRDLTPEGRLPAAEGVALRIARTGDVLSPVSDRRETGPGARVSLPLSASGRFRVEETRSGAWIEVGLSGAGSAEGAVAKGEVRYDGALAAGHGARADWVLRPSASGVEDYVVLGARPAVEAVAYDVALGPSVAGLRLVDDTLEFVDAEGAPRLRMARPTLGDRAGAHVAPRVSVEGCAVDRDPRAPHGRPPVEPGARRCAVRLDWSGQDVAYPAVLDPAWSFTGSMSCPRYFHTATELCSGKVLVVGGEAGGTCAELYDPASGTWATTAPSLFAHGRFATATLLPSGCGSCSCRVLVAGGNFHPIQKVETYDEGSGTWREEADMAEAREQHTATPVGNGCQVLIAGGRGGVNIAHQDAEIFDGAAAPAGTWTPTDSMTHKRFTHVASPLPCGYVLVMGGQGDAGAPQTAEVWDPNTGQWSLTQENPATPRWLHSACPLGDGRVLVAGGQANGTFHASAEVYDPAGDSWTTVAPMSINRSRFACTPQRDGSALVTGGLTQNGTVSPTAQTAFFGPTTNTWSAGPPLNEARYAHAATLLTAGCAECEVCETLVSAGYNGQLPKASAELLQP